MQSITKKVRVLEESQTIHHINNKKDTLLIAKCKLTSEKIITFASIYQSLNILILKT